jgi:hypothetical protein
LHDKSAPICNKASLRAIKASSRAKKASQRAKKEANLRFEEVEAPSKCADLGKEQAIARVAVSQSRGEEADASGEAIQEGKRI